MLSIEEKMYEMIITPKNENDDRKLLKYAHHMTAFLKQNFPQCVLMPTENNYSNSKKNIENGKNPAYSHKDKSTEELWKTWDERLSNKGVASFQKGLLIVMRKDMIVIDVDDHNCVIELESKFPIILNTAIQQTSKGKHYFFKRSQKCDELEIVDAARKLFVQETDSSNEQIIKKELPIDIKTVCSTGTGGVISIFPSKNKKWINTLYKTTTTVLSLPDELLEYIIDHHNDYKEGEKSKKKQSTKSGIREAKVKQNNIVEVNEAKALTKMLSVQRAHNYITWISVGWCLFSISKQDLLPTWIEFSKKSNKFVQGVCEDLWSKMETNKQKFTIGSLYYWAKEDDYYEYKMFINKSIYPLIISCNCSSNAIANIAAKILRGRFVCPDPNSNVWYEFNGTLWMKDRSRELRQTLSNEVREHFMVSISKLHHLNPDQGESTTFSHASSSQTMDEIQKVKEQILRNAHRLSENSPKKAVVEELCDILYDNTFYSKLDANPNLLAFNNGVVELDTKNFRAARPDDYLSLSVKYDYILQENHANRKIVEQFWKSLHPNEEQRTYLIKTIARQLYGDSGAERFHIHAGSLGSASNGKTSFFEVLNHCLGDYIYKFGVEHLTAVKRQEAQKPSPEFAKWKGRRILYCTEPSQTDVLNSGILKDYSGNEVFNYRMLHSNFYDSFVPQFCMHIMCNEPPKVEGECQGIKRRIRKIDYLSEFVDDPNHVDEASFKFLKNKQLILGFSKHELKMEFIRHLLDNYEHDFRFLEPEIVKRNSQMYLEDNNSVLQFVNKYIVQGNTSDFFTMRQANDAFKYDREIYNGRPLKKEQIASIIRAPCIEAKKINNKKFNYVFMGFKIEIDD